MNLPTTVAPMPACFQPTKSLPPFTRQDRLRCTLKRNVEFLDQQVACATTLDDAYAAKCTPRRDTILKDMLNGILLRSYWSTAYKMHHLSTVYMHLQLHVVRRKKVLLQQWTLSLNAIPKQQSFTTKLLSTHKIEETLAHDPLYTMLITQQRGLESLLGHRTPKWTSSFQNLLRSCEMTSMEKWQQMEMALQEAHWYRHTQEGSVFHSLCLDSYAALEGYGEGTNAPVLETITAWTPRWISSIMTLFHLSSNVHHEVVNVVHTMLFLRVGHLAVRDPTIQHVLSRKNLIWTSQIQVVRRISLATILCPDAPIKNKQLTTLQLPKTLLAFNALSHLHPTLFFPTFLECLDTLHKEMYEQNNNRPISADVLVPLLIYCLSRTANFVHLPQWIFIVETFKWMEHSSPEMEYYWATLQGAVLSILQYEDTLEMEDVEQ